MEQRLVAAREDLSRAYEAVARGVLNLAVEHGAHAMREIVWVIADQREWRHHIHQDILVCLSQLESTTDEAEVRAGIAAARKLYEAYFDNPDKWGIDELKAALDALAGLFEAVKPL